jgi:hypothetical protein
MQLVTLLLVFVIPYRLPIMWNPKMVGTNAGQTLFVLAIFNLPTAIASTAFSLSLFVVLAHRLIWPFLSKLTYILIRNEVLEKRKTVRWMGFAFIAYSLFSRDSLWHYFAEKLLK